MSYNKNTGNGVTDWYGFLDDIPYWCEYPGCYKRVDNMTHNFDKIANTHFKRYNSYWDYIYVCGYHLSKLMIRYYQRRDMLAKDSLTPKARQFVKERLELDPVTAWEDYMNQLS